MHFAVAGDGGGACKRDPVMPRRASKCPEGYSAEHVNHRDFGTVWNELRLRVASFNIERVTVRKNVQ